MDLSFLQDQANYRQIPTQDIPEAFLNSQNQPPVGTPLADLLQHGHFRRAAETSLDDLAQCAPDDAKRILQLLYTRLACLVLISRPDIASHEAAALTDVLARSPPEVDELVPLIPWELRLLLVRLQSIAAADGGRRGIMSLYALAAEVRQHIKAAGDEGRNDNLSAWSTRLSDLGLRVADTLVEMGELETATRHLDTLVDVPGDEFAYRKALLRLRVGDLGGAQRCIEKVQDPIRRRSLDALVDAANGGFTKALEQWRSLSEEDRGNGLFASNLAVGLLYTGRIAKAKEVFQNVAQQLPAFPGLLFNVGTVYELCTEQAIEGKKALAQNIAEKVPSAESGGWERCNFEFKL